MGGNSGRSSKECPAKRAIPTPSSFPAGKLPAIGS